MFSLTEPARVAFALRTAPSRQRRHGVETTVTKFDVNYAVAAGAAGFFAAALAARVFSVALSAMRIRLFRALRRARFFRILSCCVICAPVDTRDSVVRQEA